MGQGRDQARGLPALALRAPDGLSVDRDDQPAAELHGPVCSHAPRTRASTSALSFRIDLANYSWAPQLSRLPPVAAEKLGEQFVQLPALGGIQAGKQFILGGIGVTLDLLEIPPP